LFYLDYALPHIYDCATLHHPTVCGTAPWDHAARWRHSVTSSSSFSSAGNSVTYSRVISLRSSTVRFTIYTFVQSIGN
jgi:hypothetical protein